MPSVEQKGIKISGSCEADRIRLTPMTECSALMSEADSHKTGVGWVCVQQQQKAQGQSSRHEQQERWSIQPQGAGETEKLQSENHARASYWRTLPFAPSALCMDCFLNEVENMLLETC